MEYKFRAYGHKNITGKHKNTLEFTKDKELKLEGDCIIGVNADFSLDEFKKIIENKTNINKVENRELKMTIKVGDLEEEVYFEINPDFDDSEEIVVRRSDFNSKRTLGIKADKACVDFSREFISRLNDPESIISIIISNF
ncbi:MAG: DUF371 domain-containing protein [Nanoarchaeota archaeon]|nr:DUF371 domain-containing protein [Nanoarchaeota archaeon]